MKEIYLIKDGASNDVWIVHRGKVVSFVYEDESPKTAIRVGVRLLETLLGEEVCLMLAKLPWLFDFIAETEGSEGFKRRQEVPEGVVFESETDALEWILANRPQWVEEEAMEIWV